MLVTPETFLSQYRIEKDKGTVHEMNIHVSLPESINRKVPCTMIKYRF